MEPYLVVLGTAQDAGFPQANCNKKCCEDAWNMPEKRKFVSCIAIVDPKSKQQWLFDATPDIKFQLNLLEKVSKINPINGIFLTHAHIGHYTGLMQLGREVMGTHNLPVFAMKRMENFIKNNAPWDQLEKIKNNLLAAQKLTDSVEASLRKMHKKRKLSKQQKEVAAGISEIIIANEEPSDWSSKIEEYISSPIDSNEGRVKKIQDIAFTHQVDSYLASILFNSKI